MVAILHFNWDPAVVADMDARGLRELLNEQVT